MNERMEKLRRRGKIIEGFALTIIIAVFVLMIAYFVVLGVVGSNLIDNPESVGEWFSKFLNGFQSK